VRLEARGTPVGGEMTRDGFVGRFDYPVTLVDLDAGGRALGHATSLEAVGALVRLVRLGDSACDHSGAIYEKPGGGWYCLRCGVRGRFVGDPPRFEAL